MFDEHFCIVIDILIMSIQQWACTTHFWGFLGFSLARYGFPLMCFTSNNYSASHSFSFIPTLSYFLLSQFWLFFNFTHTLQSINKTKCIFLSWFWSCGSLIAQRILWKELIIVILRLLPNFFSSCLHSYFLMIWKYSCFRAPSMQTQVTNTAPQPTTDLHSRDLCLGFFCFLHYNTVQKNLPCAICQMEHVIFSNLNDILLLYPYGLVLLFSLFR